MAFYEDNGSDGKYIKIIDGSLCEKSKTELEGFKLFTTKNPETDEVVTYYIKRFKALEGNVDRLERVEIANSKIFGWNLHMSDDEGNFSVFFKDDHRVTSRLLKTFENIDLNEELFLRVWKDDDGKAAIEFKQNGTKVDQKWNGGKEGNLPQPKQSRGKWDYSAVEEFLYNNAIENILPQFADKAQAATASVTETPKEAKSSKKAETSEVPEEKIPF